MDYGLGNYLDSSLENIKWVLNVISKLANLGNITTTDYDWYLWIPFVSTTGFLADLGSGLSEINTSGNRDETIYTTINRSIDITLLVVRFILSLVVMSEWVMQFTIDTMFNH